MRVSYLKLSDDAVRTGSTCVGLVDPEIDCRAEIRDDRATVREGSLELSLELIAGERWGVSALPGVRVGRVGSWQVGRSSGRTVSAHKVMYGPSLGVETRVRPFARVAVVVTLAGYVGQLRGFTQEIIADGYTPFEDDIATRRLELGILVR